MNLSINTNRRYSWNRMIILIGILNVNYRFNKIKNVRYVKKQTDLCIGLNSDNNNNILAPILGQYNIKPQDFLLDLREKFLKDNIIDEDILNSITIPVRIIFIKNNVYNIRIKRLYNINLYNSFLTKKKKYILICYYYIKFTYLMHMLRKNLR